MQELHLKIRGVYSLPNLFSEVPEGALRRADNIVIDRESIAESRRGLKQYGTPVTSGDTDLRRIFNYQDKLLAHYGSTLKHDDGTGSWTAYSATFAEPADGFRIRDCQSNKNLYVTTAAGVMKLDDVAGAWRAAGVPRPLDGVSTLVNIGGFLPTDNNVAYRSTLHYTDGNENEIVSAPSQRLVVPNASGSGMDVSLVWYLPTGLTTEYSLRVYRSAESGDLLNEAGDELQLVNETKLTSTDIVNGYMTIVDNTPSSLRGAFLYTSPTQEGISNQNDQPPFALDACLFKDHVLYFNVKSKHRLNTTLIGAGDGALTFVADNVVTTNASAIVTSVADTSILHVGMKVKAAAGIPSTARILSIDTATQVTMTVNATATGARNVEFQDIVTLDGVEYFAASATSLVNHEFEAEIASTPATNIESTALSLVFAVNQNPTNSTVYAFYTSSFEDIPGSFSIEERGIGGDSFSISSTAGDSFNPPFPSAGLDSSNNEAPGTIMVAKPGQPEAVPLKNKFATGIKNGQRILALRDSAYALGEKIVRFTGTDISNFDTEDLDSTVKLIAPESAVVFNDAIFAMTDQGVVKISSNGVAVVSRPIEDDLLRVSSDLFTSFSELAFGVAYESARRYYLWLPDDEEDTAPTKAAVYNAFTNSWTYHVQTRTAGFVSPTDDKLYLADPELGQLFQERKTFSRLDYADEEFDVSITDSDGLTVELADTSDLAEGMLLQQDFREAIITEVVDATSVTVDTDIEWAVDDATAFTPIEGELRWVPISASNPAVLKHFQEIALLFRDADFSSLEATFSNNFFPVEETQEINAKDLGGAWGVGEYGEVPWGVPQRGEQLLRTIVPRNRQRCAWINLGITTREVFGNYKLAGLSVTFEPMSQRLV